MAIDYNLNIQSVQPVLRNPADLQVSPLTHTVGRHESAANGQVLPLQPPSDSPASRQVESAVSQISQFVQNYQRDLVFSVDKDSGRIVIKVLDSKTKELIRQIPSEVALRLARDLRSPDSLMLSEQA